MSLSADDLLSVAQGAAAQAQAFMLAAAASATQAAGSAQTAVNAANSANAAQAAVASLPSTFGGISLLTPQQLTVTALNTLSPLSHVWSGVFAVMFVNGSSYLLTGSAPAFSITGANVVWNPINVEGLNLEPGFDVAILYTRLV